MGRAGVATSSLRHLGLAALVLTTLHSIVDFSLEIPGFAAYFAAVDGRRNVRLTGAARR